MTDMTIDEHMCAFEKDVEGSEVQITQLHFKGGHWQAHTTRAMLCKCGNQQNFTRVYYFDSVNS